MNILDVSHLKIWEEGTGEVLVSDSSFQLEQGSCLAIVGESGSGKSLSCKAIMRLNKKGIRQSGTIQFGGVDLNELSEREMRTRRGKQLYLILQNGMRAFDPTCVIGASLREILRHHFGWGRSTVVQKMKLAMESVRLKDPIEIMNKYPYQLSGGMLQRIMIALAIVLEPNIIIADEPTTALDTLSKFEVVEQFIQLRERMGCSMIFVSHDLGIVRKLADQILVMRDGIIVDRGSSDYLFTQSKQEYTRYLVGSQLSLNQHFKAIMGGAGRVGC